MGRGGGGSSSDNGNPPSRHLWVGNLSHNLVEDELAHHFIRFGPLEKVAFQPGRSYAFINFEVDEDAIDAMRSLQGFPLAGNPLRIEFAKAVSVAHLILLLTFPADYMYIPQKFSFVQFNSFNQNSQKQNLGIEHTSHCFQCMVIVKVYPSNQVNPQHAHYCHEKPDVKFFYLINILLHTMEVITSYL